MVNPMGCCKYDKDGNQRGVEEQRKRQEESMGHFECKGCGEHFDNWVKKEEKETFTLKEPLKGGVLYPDTFHEKCKQCKHDGDGSNGGFVPYGCISHERCGLGSNQTVATMTSFPDFEPKDEPIEVKEEWDYEKGGCKRCIRSGTSYYDSVECTTCTSDHLNFEPKSGKKWGDGTGMDNILDHAQEDFEAVKKSYGYVRCRDCKHATNITYRGSSYWNTCAKKMGCILKGFSHVDNSKNKETLAERQCSGFEEKSCKNCKTSSYNNGGKACPINDKLNGNPCSTTRDPGLWKWKAASEEKKENMCQECGYLDGDICYSPNGKGAFKPRLDKPACMNEYKHYSEFEGYESDGMNRCASCRYSSMNNDSGSLCDEPTKRGISCDKTYRPVVKPAEDKQSIEEKKEPSPYSGKVPEKYWNLDYETCPEIDLWKAARWRFTKAREQDIKDPGNSRVQDILPCPFCKALNVNRYRCQSDSCPWAMEMGHCHNDYSAYDKWTRGEDWDGTLAKIDAKITELDMVDNPAWAWVAPNRCDGCKYWTDDGKITDDGYMLCTHSQFQIIKGPEPSICNKGKDCTNYELGWAWEAPNKCDGCKHWIDDAKVIKALKEIGPYELEMSVPILLPQSHSFAMWWPWFQNFYGAVGGGGNANNDEYLQYFWIDTDMKAEMGY